MDLDKFYQDSEWTEHTNSKRRKQPASESEHLEPMQHRKPDHLDDWRNFSHQPHHVYVNPPEIPGRSEEGECVCWGCGPDQNGPVNSITTEEELTPSSQSDVEELLELPLPLKADDDLQNQNFQHVMDARHYCFTQEGQYNPFLGNAYCPQSVPQYLQNWNDLKSWSQLHESSSGDDVELCGVTISVPQFSLPPVECPTQVGVQYQDFAEKELFLHPQEKRKTINRPEENRNVFITYSLDISLEMVTFVEFLRKHGFQPGIDLFNDPIRNVDINEWSDTYLKDPSTLVIIAISPKYKRDIGGLAEDKHGLHTKYVHTLMQTEFIQQGSLNYRFIPVLFLGTVQKHVPRWLQNTRVYSWPQETEDLLLRLLKKEKYTPPFVPVELAVIIKPMTTE